MSSGARWLCLSGEGSSFWEEGRAVLGEQNEAHTHGFCSCQAMSQLGVPEPTSMVAPGALPPDRSELGVLSPSTAGWRLLGMSAPAQPVPPSSLGAGTL